MTEFFIVSLKWTKKKDPFITFWGADNAGYRWSVGDSGRYSEERVRGEPSYYNNLTDTVAVPCEEVEKIAEIGDPGFLDGRQQVHVVRNTKARMSLLKAYAFKQAKAAA